jgi:hypothetical protein
MGVGSEMRDEFHSKYILTRRFLAVALEPELSWHCISNCGKIVLEAVCIVAAIKLDKPALVKDCVGISDYKTVSGHPLPPRKFPLLCIRIES